MFVFNIKNIRVNKKITLYELSNKTGLMRSYIRDLENNKKHNPTLSTLNKIALALDVNVKELFYSKLDLDVLKNDLYKKIDKYGLNSKKTLELNQIIDLLLNIDNFGIK